MKKGSEDRVIYLCHDWQKSLVLDIGRLEGKRHLEFLMVGTEKEGKSLEILAGDASFPVILGQPNPVETT